MVIFFHPDFTVGPGIKPDLRKNARGLAFMLTAGREFNPTLKILFN